ncbi:MAG TPA: NBR1-Ig-like domain-containing protein [Anaerolineales bacterium]|nr:NBR1-Ig-like domain-containing protein [Anaerolineales bacterium]
MKQVSRIAWLPVLLALISQACSPASSSQPTSTPFLIPNPPTPSPTAIHISPTSPPVIPVQTLEGVIAYASDRGGTPQIIAMNADGSAETSLTAGFGEFSRPAWSPDGTQIAMRAQFVGIAVMDVHRENDKLVGAEPVTIVEGFAEGPRWSPDGTKLVFVTAEDAGGWITHMTDLSTASTMSIPSIPENATDPDWSPDGNQIVFAHYTDPNQQLRDLFVINTDGSGLVRLTNTSTISEEAPIWAPDGQRIVFTASEQQEDRRGQQDIFIMNRDGTNIVRVTTHQESDFDPSWSPDGKQIVFVSDRHENNDGNYEIYLINADGTDELRLTNNHWTDRWPTWRAKQADDVPPQGCQPAIAFLEDVTIPPGTRFGTPQPFSKVWRVKNNGTCTWTPTEYTLRFVEGEQMGELTEIKIPGAIQPDAIVDLVIPQIAPDEPGRHGAHWQLFKGDGQAVTGPDVNTARLTVDIEVLASNQDLLPKPLYFLSEQSGSTQVWRMEADARTTTQVTNENQPVVFFDVSPTGKLAYVSQNQVTISESDGSTRQVVASLGSDTRLFNLAWSPDGNRLAYASNGLHVYDVVRGEDRLLIEDIATGMPGLIYYSPLKWSPDGSKLMTHAHLWEGAEIHLISTSDGIVLAKLPFVTASWNRDSQSVYLASSTFPGMIGMEPGLWRGLATGGEPEPLITQASVWWPFHRPDETLAFFMHQSTTPETNEYAAKLYVSSADGINPVVVRSWPIFISAYDMFEATWTEDGGSILVQLARPALDINEVLLLTPDETPPLFLTSEIRGFQWAE